MKIEKVKCTINYYHFTLNLEIHNFNTECIPKLIKEADEDRLSFDIESKTSSSTDDYSFRCYYHPRSYLLDATTSKNIEKRGQHFIRAISYFFKAIEGD